MAEFDQLSAALKGISLKVVLFPESTVKAFKTPIDLARFLDEEIEFWRAYGHMSLGQQVLNAFQTRRSEVRQLEFDLVNGDSVESVKDRYLELPDNFTNFPTVYSKAPAVIFYEKNSDKSPEVFLAALNAHLAQNYYSYSTISSLRGYFTFFSYVHLSKILESEYSSRIDALDGIVTKHAEQTSIQLQEIEAKYRDKTLELEELNKSKRTESERIQKEISDHLEAQKTKLSDIRTLYTENMRIDGPANYWRRFKTKYQIAAGLWIFFAAIAVAALTGTGVFLLENLPDKLFTDKISFENTLKWGVLVLIVTSMQVFLIGIFIKVALSSLHLSRDANERLQLTHQFLALLKDNAISPDERKLIFQALFARSESGLLKNENGPTIPDGALSQILKGLRG